MHQKDVKKRKKSFKHWGLDPENVAGTGLKINKIKKGGTVTDKTKNLRKLPIWEKPGMCYLIIIKAKNGNYGKPKKNKTHKIVGTVFHISDGEVAYVLGSTKTKVKRKLLSLEIVPKKLAIADKETYF